MVCTDPEFQYTEHRRISPRLGVATSNFDNTARTPRRRKLRWTIFPYHAPAHDDLPQHMVGGGQHEPDELTVEWEPLVGPERFNA